MWNSPINLPGRGNAKRSPRSFPSILPCHHCVAITFTRQSQWPWLRLKLHLSFRMFFPLTKGARGKQVVISVSSLMKQWFCILMEKFLCLVPRSLTQQGHCCGEGRAKWIIRYNNERWYPSSIPWFPDQCILARESHHFYWILIERISHVLKTYHSSLTRLGVVSQLML